MTVGLMGSQLLAKCIEEQLKGTAGKARQDQVAALKGLPAKFHTQLGALVDYPWTLSVGPDAQCVSCLPEMPDLHIHCFVADLQLLPLLLQQLAVLLRLITCIEFCIAKHNAHPVLEMYTYGPASMHVCK